MKITSKLRVLIVACIGLTLMTGAVVIDSLLKLESAAVCNNQVERLRNCFDLSFLLNEYVSNHNEKALVQWRIVSADIRNELHKIAPEEKKFAASIGDNLDRAESLLAQIVKNRAEKQSGASPVQEAFEPERMLTDQLMARIQRMVFETVQINKLTHKHLVSMQRKSWFLIFVVIAVFIGIVIVTFSFVRHALTNPINELQNRIMSAASGRFSFPESTASCDEIGQLSRAFDEMSRQLEARYSALEMEVGERRKAEFALKRAYDETERRVSERTAELENANIQLKDEIKIREQTEEALRKSERNLAEAQRIAHLGSWEMDIRTGKSQWSDELFRIFGYEPGAFDPALEKSFQLIHPDDREYANEMFRASVEDGKPYQIEKRIIRPDGEVRLVFAGGEMVRDSAGKPAKLVGILLDITESRQAEQQFREYSERLEEMVGERTKELRKAQEELLLKERLAVLGHLAGSISHEIRNPLAAIDASTYFMKIKLRKADEKVVRHLDRITCNVKQANAIIESLLNLTRMEKPKTKSHQLPELIPKIIANAKLPDSVEIVANCCENEIVVNVDAEQIRMALNNIIKNAVQAMNGKGTIAVAVRSAETGMADIEVADTGPGISSEHISKIFEPLFTTKAQGIGFGLSITKMIVENHGGTIEAKSEPGKGAAFILSLPVGRQPPGILETPEA